MLIETQTELENFCARIAASPFLTIDTEFLREKTYYPRLCLIQISSPDGNAAAIDPLVPGIDLKPVFDLLFNPAILKVIHSGRQDFEIIYNLTGRVPYPVFDTQIAAMVCGYGDSIGYENLVRTTLNRTLDKTAQFTDWSRRPLSTRQLDYALADVTHLVDVYKVLESILQSRGRSEWVREETAVLSDTETYRIDPEMVWRRIKLRSPKPKTLAVLRALAAWREREAQRRDQPRTWVLRDETLADMAAQAPQTAADLAQIRGVSNEMANGRTGTALVEVIRAALTSDRATWPQPDNRAALSPDAQAIAEILKMLLRVASHSHGVAARLIASSDDIDMLAAQDNPDTPAMKGWRFEVFGRDALALKSGAIAIGLRNGVIAKINVQ